ncbi:hypothetical protein SDC9_167926 [bioreactor metagenome]|uniref:Uncharacterized protein n=1 Tax=bioreactor metagenome TaxID=1076179 RepID=A0A645G129_9ZZZZ
MISEIIAGFSAVGGLVGLGSLVAALGAWRKSASAARELQPNHGSSISDRIDLVVDMTRSLGHQVGEIRADLRASTDQLHDRVKELERRRE